MATCDEPLNNVNVNVPVSKSEFVFVMRAVPPKSPVPSSLVKREFATTVHPLSLLAGGGGGGAVVGGTVFATVVATVVGLVAGALVEAGLGGVVSPVATVGDDWTVVCVWLLTDRLDLFFPLPPAAAPMTPITTKSTTTQVTI